MISTEFEYARATSLDDALAKLGAAKGDGKLIAGGHSLVPLMKLRMSEPKVLIDISRIPGLSGINAKDGTIEIGSGTYMCSRSMNATATSPSAKNRSAVKMAAALPSVVPLGSRNTTVSKMAQESAPPRSSTRG